MNRNAKSFTIPTLLFGLIIMVLIIAGCNQLPFSKQEQVQKANNESCNITASEETEYWYNQGQGRSYPFNETICAWKERTKVPTLEINKTIILCPTGLSYKSVRCDCYDEGCMVECFTCVNETNITQEDTDWCNNKTICEI